MAARRPLDVTRELVEAFAHDGRVTEYLVSVIPRRIWRQPPSAGHGRSIAAIVTHVHGVRRTFAKMGGAAPVPPLDRTSVTPAQARRALAGINATLVALFERALARGQARVERMPRRAVEMMTYLIEHDAHHRGQITMRARELGYAFAGEDVMRIWGWKKLP